MLNNNPVKYDPDKMLEQLKKGEKRFKVAMALIFFIISFAAVMIIISLVSSL